MKKYKIFRLTLIEVVVIVVIAVVLGLLGVSGHYKARQSARKIACISNLKQIALSMRMYSNKYQEAFPNQNGRLGLQMLAENGFLENTQCYVCPNTKDNVKNTSFISSSSSYCYAGGISEADSVDSALGADQANNHIKFGNMFFVDGHVKGYAGVSWSTNRGGSHLTDF